MKTARGNRRLIDSIREVQELAALLQQDVTISLERLIPIVESFEAGTSDPKPIAFWTRTTIRSLMGLIDGLSFLMRQAVLRCSKDAGLTITPKERDQLKDGYLRTLDSFKLAFGTFPRLFGSNYALDVGGEGWRGLKRIVNVRNKFTHPKVLEDLAIHPAFPALLPTISWVYRELLALFGDIAQRSGLSPLLLPRFRGQFRYPTCLAWARSSNSTGLR
jgi:hypothetical protein